MTCFRCKKTGRYSNECEEEFPKTTNNKKGTNLLMMNEESFDEGDYQGNGTDDNTSEEEYLNYSHSRNGEATGHDKDTQEK